MSHAGSSRTPPPPPVQATRGGTSPPSDPSTEIIEAEAPAPEVAISKSADVTPAADQDAVQLGDSIAYSYLVTNIGNVNLTSVSVDDPTIGPVTCPAIAPPGLAIGDSVTCYRRLRPHRHPG